MAKASYPASVMHAAWYRSEHRNNTFHLQKHAHHLHKMLYTSAGQGSPSLQRSSVGWCDMRVGDFSLCWIRSSVRNHEPGV